MRREFVILIGVFLSLGFDLKGQETEILDDFSVYELNKTVYISCTVTQGQTCNGINVWRSSDSVNFELVGHIAGICGSSSAPITYTFTDKKPLFNKVSYYRLELGGAGLSNILSVEVIDTRLFGFQIRPNPVKENATIYFENDSYQEHQLTLFDLKGQLQMSMNSRSNEFHFSAAGLENGVYFFIIKDLTESENPITGKLTIQH